MKRAKMLHVITHLGVGGALDNTLLTVERLPRDRFEVHLAAGSLAAAEGDGDWEERGRRCADALHILPDLQRPISPLRDLRALKGLVRLLRTQRYDIVHTHLAKAGVLGRVAARRAGVPVIVHTYHAFPWQAAHVNGATPDAPNRLSAKGRFFLELERYAASLSDGLITVCELNRQQALRLGLAPAEKLTTIYSGIDIHKMRVPHDRAVARRDLGLVEGGPVVGFVGRLSTQKDPLTFVRAARIAMVHRPGVQFLIAGSGPLAGALRAEIGECTGVRLVGWRCDVRQVLAAMDVFALSSLWEGLGRALTEAMIAGIPVAATSVDGVPELVVPGETGLLSPPGDPYRLAENILWLLEHPAEARTMADRARAHVLPIFGVDKMIERTESLYEQLLVRKRLATG